MSPEPFSSFMSRALFDPQRGYYTRNIKTVGARGDFSTSATLSPELGKRIAAWLKGAKNVIEIGAGSGQLMEQVQRSLGLLRRWQRRATPGGSSLRTLPSYSRPSRLRPRAARASSPTLLPA